MEQESICVFQLSCMSCATLFKFIFSSGNYFDFFYFGVAPFSNFVDPASFPDCYFFVVAVF